jgi:hypothetical protein
MPPEPADDVRAIEEIIARQFGSLNWTLQQA